MTSFTLAKGSIMVDLLTNTAADLLNAAVKLANNGDHKTAEKLDVTRERILAARDEFQAKLS